LLELLDEDRPSILQPRDHVLVVHDLLAHVDRGAVEVQRLLDGDHRPVDASAVAPRRGEQHGLLGIRRREDGRGAQVDAHGPESTGTWRGRAELSALSPRLACVALETSPEKPAPVRQIANAISGWIDRLGP